MMAACSTAARRGGLDWAPIFEHTNRPIFEQLYACVRDGSEARRVLDFERQEITTLDLFEKELKELRDQEIWRVGAPQSTRSLIPYLNLMVLT